MKVQDAASTEQRLSTAPAHYASVVEHDGRRFAVVVGARSVREVEAYLPDNYGIMESFPGTINGRERLVVVIGGHDSAGWGLDTYVIPRLRSGSIACEELH